MRDNRSGLGLDVGALAVKAACSDGRSAYRIHRGEPEEAILSIIGELGEPGAVAVTGSGGRRIADSLGLSYVDPAVALIAATEEGTTARHIIDIGGGSLSIVDLDEEGRFAGFRTNSLCAAGTGSFLDEQAARMKLTDDEKAAERAIAEPPRIAARCAVFAKSDLIHRQQEGFTIPEMWSGLCRGMVQTALSTLFRGRRPSGPVLLAGGVAKNREVVRWLIDGLAAELILPPAPETFSARGALRCAKEVAGEVRWPSLLERGQEADNPRRPELSLSLSRYPDFSCRDSFVDDGTEVRLHGDLAGDVAVGIDVGSTSTKAAVVDMRGEVVADFYRRTSGNPIDAAQRLLAAISRAARGAKLNIRALGTTGSGRKMVGAILGADRIINEITAHVKGASREAPDVETIFEIGGQDAKFVSLREGVPHDSNMNYVCAAGTGSFIEEQAAKLGYDLTEIGDAVMGARPPFSSDRCTVFMEQDVHALIRQGFERREVMGSVLYSVVQNYLNRVVGRRPYSRGKICFMGATARNRGLVAAFEKLVGCPVTVSPYCHVMGAYGVALIALDEVALKGLPTTFRGLGFADAHVELTHEECRLCSNCCRITKALVDGMGPDEATSWGYMCGRDPEEKRVRVNPCYDPIRARQKAWRHSAGAKEIAGDRVTVGMPLCLLNHTYMPFWKTFFEELGARVRFSKPTDEGTLAQAQEFITADYCYPVKLAHGHIRQLACDPAVDHLFLPYIVQGEPHDDRFSRSVFCPYNIALPSIVSAAGLLEDEETKILKPVINFQWRMEMIADSMLRELPASLRADRRSIGRAWNAARRAQDAYTTELEKIGAEALARIERDGGKAMVVLGRPYNLYDSGANLGLPQKIADLEITVLTADMLPVRGVPIDPLFRNMYWRYGRRLLQAAHFTAKHPSLYAVFLTNFGCGPDSFLQTYVEHIMKGKPMLMLELDEHSADAGYITRLEAFRDVISGKKAEAEAEGEGEGEGEVKAEAEAEVKGVVCQSPVTSHQSRTPETVWLPPMHPFGVHTMAAALRSVGVNARPMPDETIESFTRAKSYCRGTECVPAPATIGAFLEVLERSDDPRREVLFMPSAKGPCRFGQYSTLHRMILDEAGYRDTRIEAWDDESGTYGTDLKTSRRLYNALTAGDLLFKARCRVRPYAKDRDAFDALMQEELLLAERAIESGRGLERALSASAERLSKVERMPAKKPLVGIVGEIYVRCNTFTNGRLVETIEDAGGEAWLAPVTEWFQYLAFMDSVFAAEERMGALVRLRKGLKNAYMMRKGRSLAGCMARVIGDRAEPPVSCTVAAGERYMPRRFDGESILTVGRAVEFARQGAGLIINCAPFGCMPGTLTAGMFQGIERELGVPIVSLFFDGETDLTRLVRTYITNITSKGPGGGVPA
ncbi:MAG: hypothetical protein JXA24_05925 [Proteobacteria bacterium]|nr:hypothetical protein [Pseudomonadota bacterium]